MIVVSQGELVAFIVGVIVIVLGIATLLTEKKRRTDTPLEPWAQKWIATHRSRSRSTAPAPPSAESGSATPHDPPPTA